VLTWVGVALLAWVVVGLLFGLGLTRALFGWRGR
jgi:hypothetical protein